MKNVMLKSIVKNTSKDTVNSETKDLITQIIINLFLVKGSHVKKRLEYACSAVKDDFSGFIVNVLTEPIKTETVVPNAVKTTISVLRKVVFYQWLLTLHKYAERYPGYGELPKDNISKICLVEEKLLIEAMKNILNFLNKEGCGNLLNDINSILDPFMKMLEYYILVICTGDYLSYIDDYRALAESIAKYIYEYISDPSKQIEKKFERRFNEVIDEVTNLLENNMDGNFKIPKRLSEISIN